MRVTRCKDLTSVTKYEQYLPLWRITPPRIPSPNTLPCRSLTRRGLFYARQAAEL
jgi:hypothetical protein